ncbi:MAG: carboxypeptidase regulatory-like domain-containing protein, partial [Gemmatimonadota bacterium]|nr:carboxypeptidase regulatory-like domain-containing protein [Gemmatimonadota bacterium]
MRVFWFYRPTTRGGCPRGTGAVGACGCEGLTLHGRVFLAVLGALALPGPATAIQWPGELSGRVVDSLTGTTLGAVEVLVEPGSWRTSTDASGSLLLRGLEPGSYRVSFSRLGYGRSYRDVVRGGRGEFPNPPDVVAYPRDEDEIAAVLDWCSDQGIVCIPFGGGSSVV